MMLGEHSQLPLRILDALAGNVEVFGFDLDAHEGIANGRFRKQMNCTLHDSIRRIARMIICFLPEEISLAFQANIVPAISERGAGRSNCKSYLELVTPTLPERARSATADCYQVRIWQQGERQEQLVARRNPKLIVRYGPGRAYAES